MFSAGLVGQLRGSLSLTRLNAFLERRLGAMRAPKRVVVVDALPRKADGAVRTEILQLIAMNQVDLIDSLIASEDERAIVRRIVDGRQNWRDRFSF